MTDRASTDALRAFAAGVAELATMLETEGFPADETDRAYGVRHTLRQLVMAVQSEVEFGDPTRPRFHRYEQPWLQWGGPNPDNVYLRAAIAPEGRYRVWGNVRGVRAAIFSLVDGDMHLGSSVCSPSARSTTSRSVTTAPWSSGSPPAKPRAM